MGIIKDLREAMTDLREKRLFGFGPTDDWSYVDSFTGPAKDVKLLGVYSGITYRCIDMIARSIGGEYAPYVYTIDSSGKKTTVNNHPFITLLQNPNPDLTMFQLFQGSATFLEQFGEFFWYMVPGSISGYGNGVKEIYLLRPDKMGIVLDKATGEVIGYNYSAGTGNNHIPFTPEEIVHQMNFNPRNPYRGYSTVEAAIDYIQTEEEVSRFTKNYFHNNAAMSGILNVTGKMSKTAWQKFVRQWRERYTGVENAGKVGLVRDSQTSFTQIGSNLGDMQLTDLKQATVEQILMMFNIPKELLGMSGASGLGRADIETREYIYAKWNINNKLDQFDDTLQQCLKSYYPKSSGSLVDHENIIPHDKEYQLELWTAGVDKWITREEIRSGDPLTANNEIDGADQLFVLNTQLPIDDAMTSEQSASKPSQIIMPPSSSNNDDAADDEDEAGSEGDDDGDDDEDDKSKSVKITLVKTGSKKKIAKSLKYTIEQKEAFRLSLQQNANKYAEQYSSTMQDVLAAQEKTVLGNIQHLAAGLKKKDLTDDLFNSDDQDDDFETQLMPVVTTLAAEQGALALVFSGDNTTKYTLTASVKAALQKSLAKMASNFDAETLSQLNDTLTAGITAGESIKQLSDRVADVYQQANDYRTDRVARTESQNASNSATLDAYNQNPVVTSMEWYANPGACEYCEELDGTVVGLSESFVSNGDSVDVDQDDGSTDSYEADYGDVDTPPLHPNCSCTIIPVTDADN